MATIPIFDGTNYKIWSVKMKTLFLSKDLWDTVQNGYNHEANRETDEETKKNQKKDAAALSHIQQGVSDRIFPIIEDATTAKEAWRNLLFSTEQLYGPDYRNVMTPEDLRQTGENHLIVATLVATVAFTAGFTMPGGYNSKDGLNQGMVILTREAAFKAFMVTDTIAMSLSISAVLIHFYAAITNNPDMLENQVYTAAYLIIFAVVAMVLAFVTGTCCLSTFIWPCYFSLCYRLPSPILFLDYPHHQKLY